MTARSTFAIACALIVALAHCAELGSVQTQLRSFLQNDMIATAKAGYQPSAFTIPGAELTLSSEKFLNAGTFSVSNGFDSSCSGAFSSVAVAADSCIVDGVFSYKLQLKTDGCAGAQIQYFYDDACHLYAGSSELTADVEKCSVGYHDHKGRAVYTSLTCSAQFERTTANTLAHLMTIVTDEPTAEPTVSPTAEPSAEPTITPTAISAAPTITPTITPTAISAAPSSGPTVAPTGPSTLAPTRAPTARPSVAVTAYPTAAGTSVVTVNAQQTINGITLAQYNTNADLYSSTLKTTIAACMDGVSASDITNFLAADASSSSGAKFQVHLRALAGTNAILITYRIVTNSKLTSSQIFSQLNNKVSDGTFTILLQQNANSDTATYLMSATSEDVNTIGGGNNARLSGGAIAAIVVGVVFGAALILLALYLIVVGAGGSGESEYIHKPVEAGPPAEL